jgi:hypothetical protein
MKIPMLPVCLLVCAIGFVSASAQDVTVLDEFHVVPKVLHDAKTKIIFYLESDGRHISAISPEGKLLWSRDPFVDAKLPPYRLKRPLICYFNFVDPVRWKTCSHFGRADDFICVTFDSSEFGIIKKETGDFTFFGQD